MVKTLTWNKDSNELLDYESNDVTKSSFETRTGGTIVKKSDIIKFISDKNKFLSELKAKFLAELENDQNNFYLLRSSLEETKVSQYVNKAESPWMVVKGFKSLDQKPGYKLSVGDVIKLGRIKLKISNIKLDSALEESLENNTKHFATKLADHNDKSKEEGLREAVNESLLAGKKRKTQICRICYCDEKEMDSPLIQPCSCSGTMKYIHLICLQKWLKSKVVTKTSSSENSIIYTLKQIECELCKTLLPGKNLKQYYKNINYTI